mgnify:FL=1|jgi:hypothetical protein
MGLISSLVKSYKLRKISKILMPVLNQSLQSATMGLLDGNRRDELNNAISDLYCIAKKDPTTKPLLDEFIIDESSFRELYWSLIKNGGPGYIKGHWIPASTLVFGDTLEYVLKVNNNSNLSMRDAIYRVKDYFDKNEIGEIEINK